MKIKNISKKIIVGITGSTDKEWQDKLKEIEKFKISRAALFLEMYLPKQRQKIYEALERSYLKEIPLIHIREDMDKKEISFLCKKYNNTCLTIHENEFKHLDKWDGFHKHLFLEMNYDNKIIKEVEIDKIGGFCIDLSHFKAAEEKWSKEFKYITKREKFSKYFVCNHLNGYSYKKNSDIHTVTSLKEFNYLKTLPKFLFGEVIALETFNSIEEQLKFKKYIVKLLS